MNPQRMTVASGEFPEALSRAVLVATSGEARTDQELLDAIATLNAVADHAVAEMASPRREGEVFAPPQEGGPQFGQGRVAARLNPADDQAMASYIQQMAQAGAFRSVDPSGTGTKAGAPLASSQVPYEDRGRTDPLVQSGANVLEDMPPLPGVSPSVVQWVPVAIWAIRKVGEVVAKWRQKG